MVYCIQRVFCTKSKEGNDHGFSEDGLIAPFRPYKCEPLRAGRFPSADLQEAQNVLTYKKRFRRRPRLFLNTQITFRRKPMGEAQERPGLRRM